MLLFEGDYIIYSMYSNEWVFDGVDKGTNISNQMENA